MTLKEIYQHQIFRLAKIYRSRNVCVANLEWHHKVLKLQVVAIKAKKSLKSQVA